MTEEEVESGVLKDNGRSETLEEIGRSFGITREGIRQREEAALRKLRKVILSNPGVRMFFSDFG